jgi:hypothetical protein
VTYGRLAPKEQKLLGSSHLIIIDGDLPFTRSIRRMVDDAGLEEDQGDGGHTASVRFHGSVAPLIIPIESTGD